MVTGADFANPALLIARAVLPLRFHVASIAVPFDLLMSRIGMPCWRAIIQEVRRERALDAHVPGTRAANAAASFQTELHDEICAARRLPDELGQDPLGAVKSRSIAASRIAPGDVVALPARVDRIRFARSDARLEGRAATARFVIGGLFNECRLARAPMPAMAGLLDQLALNRADQEDQPGPEEPRTKRGQTTSAEQVKLKLRQIEIQTAPSRAIAAATPVPSIVMSENGAMILGPPK